MKMQPSFMNEINKNQNELVLSSGRRLVPALPYKSLPDHYKEFDRNSNEHTSNEGDFTNKKVVVEDNKNQTYIIMGLSLLVAYLIYSKMKA